MIQVRKINNLLNAVTLLNTNDNHVKMAYR
jgi:hypothetical protein